MKMSLVKNEKSTLVSTVDTLNESSVSLNHENESEFYENVSVSTHSANNIRSVKDSEVLLSIAKVLVYDKSENTHEVRALLDCGSQSNFITSDLAKLLNLNQKEVNLSIVGINSSISKSTKLVEIKLQSKFCNFQESLSCFILNKIAGNLPMYPVNKDLKIPSNINLTDNTFNMPDPIDILLGNNIFFNLLSIGQIKTAEGMPIMQKTKLGWIISGSVPFSTNMSVENKGCVQSVCSFSSSNVQDQLEKFWSMDEVPQTKILKKEEQECEEFFVSTTKHASNGQFIVELPFNENIEKLGESKEIAIKRYLKLEKKLTSNKVIREQYKVFLEEYERLGHMTLIPKSEIECERQNLNYYLPHHPVFKDSSTTKLRVVFDASAKTSTGVSLNDTLSVGQ